MNDRESKPSLAATEFLDWESPAIHEFVGKAVGSESDPLQQAIRLFYAVRDKIRYDVYGVDMTRHGLKASSILENRAGFCIHKSIVFAAAARKLGIPSKLVFSDVKNHIGTPALRDLVGGDVFRYHAYVLILLRGRWVKATPVFNSALCRLFGIEPLGFDGVHDAVFQSYDKNGNACLEFIAYHGAFDDLPYEQCISGLRHHHPRLFMSSGRTARGNLAREIHMANDEARAPRLQGWPVAQSEFSNGSR